MVGILAWESAVPWWKRKKESAIVLTAVYNKCLPRTISIIAYLWSNPSGHSGSDTSVSSISDYTF